MISATFVTGLTVGVMTVVCSLLCVPAVRLSMVRYEHCRAVLAKFSPMSKFLA